MDEFELKLQQRIRAGKVSDLHAIRSQKEGAALCPNHPKNDFEGYWIWLADGFCEEQRNCYAYFRKEFNAQGQITVCIAADTFYDLFVDGERVDRGTATGDIAYKTFDTHVIDVDDGEHVIGVLVHHLGETCGTAMKSRPGLFVEMTTAAAAAAGEKIVTDRGWKVFPAGAYEQELPCMMSHYGFYEVCDLRKVPQGWSGVSFDDHHWHDAAELGGANCEPWIRMIPRDIPLLATTSHRGKRQFIP